MKTTLMTQAVRAARTSNPPTALKFFASVFFGAPALAIAATVALHSTPSLRYLIPIIWAVAAVVAVAVLIFVMISLWHDPKKLQLTEVSGREYLELMIQGACIAGDMQAVTLELPASGAPQGVAESGNADGQ